MAKLAEIAYYADMLADQPDSDAVIRRVSERLSILGATHESAELAQLSADLLALVSPPSCRWCGRTVDARKSYWGLGAIFCSTTCREEALVPDPAPEVPHG